MCNDISCDGMKNLAELGQKLSLLSLRVNGNKIGSEGGQYLAMFLEKNSYIHHLDMAESDQTALGLACILRVLQYANNSLQFLDISRPIFKNRVQEGDTLYIAECIADTLKCNSALKELVVQKMGFVDSDLEVVVEGLIQNKTLLLLDLSCNELGDDSLTLLSQYLFEKPPLRVLLLGHNKLRDIGLESLSRSFQCSRIEVLDLAANQFTDSGIESFLNTIKKPFPIKALYLWGNAIGKKSARILRRMLYSGVLVQEALDVLVHRVDHELNIARNPVDRYKHIYYCVGNYGFPPPARIKPPQPDVVSTQRIHQHMPLFKPRIEKQTESGVCSQAVVTSYDAKKVFTEEFQDSIRMECKSPSDKESGSLKADELQMEIIIERMRQAPTRMIPMRLEDEKCLRKTSSKNILAQTSSAGCIHYFDDVIMPELPVLEEEKETADISIQTSLEFEGMPRFSLPYVPYTPPYPIGMVSILEEEENKLRAEPNLVEEVESAYVRKFQLPDVIAEEELDLSEDVNYKINTEPLTISRELKLEPVLQPEEEDEHISIPEKVSSYVSSKSEIGETISKYQILEKNIYGIQPPAPLHSDYEDSLQASLRELRRDSERSTFEVIEDCNRVNTQRSHMLAWQQFGQEIISWAIKKAFEEIEIHEERMDKRLFEDAFEGVTAISYALGKVVERVLEEITAERGSLVKQELDLIKEKAVSNIHAYLEDMEQEDKDETIL